MVMVISYTLMDISIRSLPLEINIPEQSYVLFKYQGFLVVERNTFQFLQQEGVGGRRHLFMKQE